MQAGGEASLQSAVRRKTPKPITSAQAAADLGVSTRTIIDWAGRWADSGGEEGLQGHKIGRAWRFEREVIRAIASGERQLVLASSARKIHARGRHELIANDDFGRKA